jgi:hypothetical protein
MIGSCRVRNDYNAARDYSWPTRAAFAMALSDGGIVCPLRMILSVFDDANDDWRRIDENAEDGFALKPVDGGVLAKLECDHFVMLPPPKAKTERNFVGRKRACPHCAHVRYDERDPKVGREFARWAASKLEMLQSHDCDAARAQALESTRRRFSLATVKRFGTHRGLVCEPST